MSVATHCHGCGVELPAASKSLRNRKWCSERCRKAQYAGRCVDCGGPTDGSNGRGPNAAKRCATCSGVRLARRRIEQAALQRALVEQLWAEGKTAREIAAVVGWSCHPGTYICCLRNRHGYNLPHRRTREQIARITADGGEHLRRARAARKAAA